MSRPARISRVPHPITSRQVGSLQSLKKNVKDQRKTTYFASTVDVCLLLQVLQSPIYKSYIHRHRCYRHIVANSTPVAVTVVRNYKLVFTCLRHLITSPGMANNSTGPSPLHRRHNTSKKSWTSLHRDRRDDIVTSYHRDPSGPPQCLLPSPPTCGDPAHPATWCCHPHTPTQKDKFLRKSMLILPYLYV